ncbi:Protein mak11 [Massospora cicadina]|nr:Protein mak11 [Massospora cicadina]
MTLERKVHFAAIDGDAENSPSEQTIGSTDAPDGLFEVFAGTYERILYGFKFSANPSHRPLSEEEVVRGDRHAGFPYQLTPEFIFPAHIGSIRTIAAGPGRHMSTGSTDEIIKLYDLKRRKELGFLSEHNGTITCLKFIGKSHLVSGSEDTAIMIWRTKDWECLKVLRGHKGRINDISPHPSGKLALSVGDDRVLLAWNLMTGQRASSIRLDSSAEKVAWSPLGDMYTLMFQHAAHVYRAASPQPFCKIDAPSVRAGFMTLGWVLADGKQYLAFGCGDGSAQLYGPMDGSDSSVEEISVGSLNHLCLLAHGVRVKGLCVISRPSCTVPRALNFGGGWSVPHHFMVTASSDGLILVWDLSRIISDFLAQVAPRSTAVDLVSFIKTREASDFETLVLAAYNARARITCLSANLPSE